MRTGSSTEGGENCYGDLSDKRVSDFTTEERRRRRTWLVRSSDSRFFLRYGSRSSKTLKAGRWKQHERVEAVTERR